MMNGSDGINGRYGWNDDGATKRELRRRDGSGEESGMSPGTRDQTGLPYVVRSFLDLVWTVIACFVFGMIAIGVLSVVSLVVGPLLDKLFAAYGEAYRQGPDAVLVFLLKFRLLGAILAPICLVLFFGLICALLYTLCVCLRRLTRLGRHDGDE